MASRSDNGAAALAGMVIAAVVVGFVGLTMTGCTVNREDAVRALEAQGMKDVRIGGYSFWGCSDKDTFKSSFKAVGANGKPVSGTVCSGVFKGITVRFD